MFVNLSQYKILLFFIIGLEAVLIFYYGFDEDSLSQLIKRQIHEWVDVNDNKSKEKLDNVQTYVSSRNFGIRVFYLEDVLFTMSFIVPQLHCCERSKNGTIRASCCPSDVESCKEDQAFNTTCVDTATEYFKGREARYTWYISQITFPEVKKNTIIFQPHCEGWSYELFLSCPVVIISNVERILFSRLDVVGVVFLVENVSRHFKFRTLIS